MTKILLLVILQFTVYGSNILLLKENTNKINALSHTYYVQDKDSHLNANDILTSTKLTLYSKSNHIGNKEGPFWSKLSLVNDSNKSRAFIIHNQLPGTNYIDVYLYKDDVLRQTHLLGDMREQKSKTLVNRFSAFELILAPKEKITIISKVDNFSLVKVAWIIQDSKSFIEGESKFLIVFSLVGGVFFIFILISLLSYVFYKHIAYLIIAVYITNTFIYQFAVQGVFYTLDIGINLDLNTFISWVAPSTGAIVPLLFAYYFFNMKVKYKRLSYLLKFLLFLNLIIIFSTIHALFIDDKYFTLITFFIGASYWISVVFLLFIGFYMKGIGSKFYLSGQILLFLAITLNGMAIYGLIEFHNIYRHSVTIAVLVEIILFFIAQSLKTQKSLNELSQVKVMLIEQSRFSSMGQAIGHITHQWKHPLTLLGTSVALLETILKHDKKNVTTHLEKELPPITESISHMKKTMTELSTFYSGEVKKISFSPRNTINNIMELLSAKINLKNTSININIDDDIIIHNYEHIFSNIILVLIDNSLDAFKNIQSNIITLTIVKDDKQYILTYTDNAGGIRIEPIEDVFEYFITTKGKKEGQGMGLALAKMLVNDRLDGSIMVKNTNDGVQFTIHF